MENQILFKVITPLDFSVRTTESHWNYIVEIKHPIMKDKIDDVIATLSYPDEIRKSTLDSKNGICRKILKVR